MKPLAVSTQLFGAQQLSQRHLEMIARAGFHAVEVFAAPGHFDWEGPRAVARIARALRALELEVCSLHAPWAPGQDVAALDAQRREYSLGAAERAVDALLALGGRVLVLHPGAEPAGPAARAEQLRLAEAAIARLATYCRMRGVRVALENPPPHELGGANAEMLDLYRLFMDEPTVQACFDTGHAHLTPEGVGFVRQVPKELLLVHLSDNAGQADDHLPPTAGRIPWAELLAVLAERRFDGYPVLELTGLPQPERILEEGYRWMRQAWPRAR